MHRGKTHENPKRHESSINNLWDNMFCIYFSFCSISYYSLSLHYIFHTRGFYEIAFHLFIMHRFSQKSFAEMAASTRLLPRTPILPIEDIEAMQGKFLSENVTTTSREQIGICVYTTPTYNVLKEEKYKSILVKVGLGGVLNMLPLGVDLQACAHFIATYDAC